MYTTMNSSDNNERIELITEVQRRRRWTSVEKLALVQRTFEAGQSVSLVARQADISIHQPTVPMAQSLCRRFTGGRRRQ
ncbi:MAG TPA: hypothetical protein DD666_09520 [Advenella kashmirensis]|uniref:Transposase n=1 Tax=Advenella kashmirensis TaxID=310575 RepID=A0A356LF45_9BURK|nr:hypothetical protein [Advenella kashmirensis]